MADTARSTSWSASSPAPARRGSRSATGTRPTICTISVTSSSVSGATRTATSPSSSTSRPPSPTTTNGPSKGSRLAPTIISWPAPTCSCTRSSSASSAIPAAPRSAPDRPGRLRRRRRCRHPQPDAAHVALVDGGGNLDDDRAPKLGLGRLGFVRSAHVNGAGHGDAVRPQQSLGVRRGQPAVVGTLAGPA